ncbi:MAG TPA: hypothetical protein VEW95_04160 [Candidatus Limnocylindrales bacterium]|nr:hypothetical protein [Candidatus Limnocylindrales bacterium]
MNAEPLSPNLQAEIEQWFVRRGVPQLIDGYTTEQRMDARAAPYVVAWIAAGTILWWGVRPDWSAIANAAGVLGTLAFIAFGLTAARLARGLRPWPLSPDIRPLDIALLGVLIGTAAGVIEGSLREFIIAALNSLLGIGIIYAIVGFGILEIGLWGIGRLGDEIVKIAGLLARTLPILLILVLFLLFASEIWEAAHELTATELAAVLSLMLLVAVLLIVTTLQAEMRTLNERSWDAVIEDTRGTPAEPLSHVTLTEGALQLGWLQRMNVTLLVEFSQLIQSVFVGVLVTAFLVALGLLTLPAALQERWVGDSVGTLWRFELLGETRTLSDELVTVASLLGGVVGLYFTGLAVTDATYRADHFSRVMDEVRQLLAARAVYVAALRAGAEVQRP